MDVNVMLVASQLQEAKVRQKEPLGSGIPFISPVTVSTPFPNEKVKLEASARMGTKARASRVAIRRNDFMMLTP
jgi:hypothetical protein